MASKKKAVTKAAKRAAPTPDGEFIRYEDVSTTDRRPWTVTADDFVFPDRPPSPPAWVHRALWVAWAAFTTLCFLSLAAAVVG